MREAVSHLLTYLGKNDIDVIKVNHIISTMLSEKPT